MEAVDGDDLSRDVLSGRCCRRRHQRKPDPTLANLCRDKDQGFPRWDRTLSGFAPHCRVLRLQWGVCANRAWLSVQSWWLGVVVMVGAWKWSD